MNLPQGPRIISKFSQCNNSLWNYDFWYSLVMFLSILEFYYTRNTYKVLIDQSYDIVIWCSCSFEIPHSTCTVSSGSCPCYLFLDQEILWLTPTSHCLWFFISWVWSWRKDLVLCVWVCSSFQQCLFAVVGIAAVCFGICVMIHAQASKCQVIYIIFLVYSY